MLCVNKQQDPDVDIKKTDAVVEDDPHQSEDEKETEKKEENGEKDKQSKADLEGPDNDTHEVCFSSFFLFKYISQYSK